MYKATLCDGHKRYRKKCMRVCRLVEVTLSIRTSSDDCSINATLIQEIIPVYFNKPNIHKQVCAVRQRTYTYMNTIVVQVGMDWCLYVCLIIPMHH